MVNGGVAVSTRFDRDCDSHILAFLALALIFRVLLDKTQG